MHGDIDTRRGKALEVKLVPTLGEVKPGLQAQLEFGGVWVRVFDHRRTHTHCRVVHDDGTEGEPHAVPSTWKVIAVRKQPAREENR